MSESPVETREKAIDLPLIWTGGLTSLEISGVTWSSMLQKVMIPFECEIARCSSNQVEMTPDSPALALKFVFVQRRQDSCLVKRDTSGI